MWVPGPKLLLAISAVVLVSACTASSSVGPTATSASRSSGTAGENASLPPSDLATPAQVPVSLRFNQPIVLPKWAGDVVAYAREALLVIQDIAHASGLYTTPVSTEVIPTEKEVACEDLYYGYVADNSVPADNMCRFERHD